MEKHLYLWN